MSIRLLSPSSSHHRPAFTLIEMLTTVAVLVIVLGLMVSLARHVREKSAQALTKNLLRRLDGAMTEYVRRNERRAERAGFDAASSRPSAAFVAGLPEVSPFPPPKMVAAAAADALGAGRPA